MTRGRAFLLLLALAAGVGAYVWFVEMPRDTTAADTTGEKLFTVDATQMQEVVITNEAGERSTLTKRGDRWTLAEIDGAEADPTEAGNITSGLAALETQRVVDEQPPSLAEYGLEAPRVTVSFKDASGAEQTILFGNKTPTGGDLYAKLASSPRVFLVGAWLDESFNRSRFDLRDKTVARFSRDAVTNVTLTSSAGTVSLAQSGGEWRLTAPVEGPADGAAADAIVNAVSAARMQSILDGPEAAAVNFARPAVTVAITAGPTRSVLEIGGAADDGTRYARDTVRGLVFTVDAALAGELTKSPGDLRKKDQ
ncbi:MAG: DUF4340 domain-containing protein [Acidobacteria bacterium]|nr:DUF4340 domain-containing protein [Acidobacteriota bacterium]